MKLKNYIENMGDAEFAKKLKISERCAYSWRKGDRKPPAHMAIKINRMTKRLDAKGKVFGVVTFEECYPDA